MFPLTPPMSPTMCYVELLPTLSLSVLSLEVPWYSDLRIDATFSERSSCYCHAALLYCFSLFPILINLKVSCLSIWLPVQCRLPAPEGETLEGWRLIPSKQCPGSSSPHLSYWPIPMCQSPTVTYSHLASSSHRKFKHHSSAWVPSVALHSSASKPRFLIRLTISSSPDLILGWHWFVMFSTCPTGPGPWLAHQARAKLKQKAGIQWLTRDDSSEPRWPWKG